MFLYRMKPALACQWHCTVYCSLALPPRREAPGCWCCAVNTANTHLYARGSFLSHGSLAALGAALSAAAAPALATAALGPSACGACRPHAPVESTTYVGAARGSGVKVRAA